MLDSLEWFIENTLGIAPWWVLWLIGAWAFFWGGFDVAMADVLWALVRAVLGFFFLHGAYVKLSDK